MEITAQNGKTYEIRFDNLENIEIERDDEITGLRKVFVFQDISIGNFESGRKEVIFYSYDISPTGERINKERHNYYDTENEFASFLNSHIWQSLTSLIIGDFFKKIEFTHLENNIENNTDKSE